MGVVSSAQLQDDSAGSTDNEATKIVEKTSTISHTDQITQTDSNDNIESSRNSRKSASEDKTIQTSTDTSKNVSSSKMNSHDIVANSNKTKTVKASSDDLQRLIDEADGQLDLDRDYSGYADISKNITINGHGYSIDGDGGPIFNIASKDISVTLKDIIFGNGLSDGGGAIANTYRSSSLTIINCEFVKNSAEKLYGDTGGPGGAIYTLGELNITNSYFYKNNAPKSGGAVYCENNLFVNNSTFIENTAGDGYFGGAICCGKIGGNFTILNSVFENNKARGGYGDGGAIYCESGNLVVNNTNFTNNNVLDYGGAVYIDSKYDPIFISCIFEKNTAEYGGAIYYQTSSDEAELKISECTFNNNEAEVDGGAIYSEGYVNITESTFKKNKATKDTSAKSYGGAIRSKGIGTFIRDSTFEDNFAYNHGGAIYADGYIDIKGSTFTDNEANVDGGAVYGDKSVDLSNSIFNNNAATGKTSAKSFGGAVRANEFITVTGCDFSNNYAYNRGGAVYADTNIKIIYTNFTANTAKDYGGAVYTNTLNDKVLNSIFNKNNCTSGDGGAIYINNKCTPEFESSSFEDNLAKDRGGGIYIDSKSAPLGLYECTFINNIAGKGGAVFTGIMTKSVKYSVFLKNKANSGDGGAVYINNECDVDFTSCRFEENKCYKRGGAIYLDSKHANLNLKYCTFVYNHANRTDYHSSYYHCGGGQDVFNSGYYDSIEQCWFGENDPDFKDRLVEYHESADDEDHTPENHLKIGMKVNETKRLNIGETYKVDVYFYIINHVLYLNGDLLHSTGDFYAANIDDVTYSNVKADGNNMSADVLIRNDNPTLKFKLDEQVITLKLETNDRNPSEVKILSCDNTTYPGELKVSYRITNMTDNATYVILDEDNPEIIVKEGIITDAESTLTVENIKPGHYIIRIDNHANTTTKSSYALARFKVSSKEISVNVTADNVTYGNPTTITLTADADGTYYMIIGAKTYTMEVNKGVCVKEVKFNAGNYQTYTSSLDYSINCNEASFHVDKAVNNVVVEVENVSYGELSNIIVKADVDGSCDVKINGTTYNIPVSNGVGNKSVQLNAGKFYANVGSYYGNKIFYDSNYNTVTHNATFMVYKADIDLVVVVFDEVYPYEIESIVYASVDGDYNLTIAGDLTCVTVRDNLAFYEHPTLDAGRYEATISFRGDENYKQAFNRTTFTVNPVGTSFELDVNPDTVTYGKTATVTHTLSEGATGTIKYYLNDGTFLGELDVGDNLTLPVLDAGSYVIIGNYSGDYNFIESMDSTNFKVNPKANNASVTATNVTYGEDTLVQVTADVDGIYQLDVNGTLYNITVNNGIGNKSLMLDSGIYYANISFNDKNYNTTSNNTSFEVYKADSNMIVVAAKSVYPEEILGIVYSDVDGEYNLTISDYSSLINVTDGFYEFNAGIFDVGNYTINVTFPGDRNHKSNTSSTNVTVAKLVPNLSLVVQDIDYGDTALIVITSDVTGSVNITVNNKTETINLTQTTMQLSDQAAPVIKTKTRGFLTLDNLNVGTYPVTIVYNGDNNIESVNTSDEFKVNPAANNASVTATNVTYGEDTLIEVTADIDGIYQLDVNGTIYNITVNNGIGNKTFTLNTGDYYANITLNNKNYNTKTKNTTFTVSKAESIITTIRQTSYLGENITLKATITDTKGNLLNGGKVVFKLNNMTLKDSNGKTIITRVKNGTAEISYFIPYTYQAKTHNITAVYEGNGQYIGSRSNPTSLDLKQREAKLTLTSTSNKKVGENITFNVTVTDKQDQTRRVNGYVIFKINGLTLKDKNGQTIMVEIKDNKAIYNYTVGLYLSARTHTITALLVNNTYTRSQNNTTFNITRTTTIIQLDTPILNNNQVQVTGQLLDQTNHPIPGTTMALAKLNGLTIKNTTGDSQYYMINDGKINITLPEYNYKRDSYTITVVTEQRGSYTGARKNITLTIPKNKNNKTIKSAIITENEFTNIKTTDMNMKKSTPLLNIKE
ncbi:hypothetical protein AW729_00330 [Methanosphaera sp. BMS]|nr:hypothetical protein AW729_00330 [Methanosphaera sp. BMS]